MDVILLERIEKLGAIGDVVKVKDGFARNFLLPRKKALRANEANRKVFESNRTRIEADNASRRSDAEKEAQGFKAIGVYDVKGALHPEVAVAVRVNVARSPEEAEVQASGVDVMSQMFERDEAGFVEAYDPNAEPGATAEAPSAEPAAN